MKGIRTPPFFSVKAVGGHQTLLLPQGRASESALNRSSFPFCRWHPWAQTFENILQMTTLSVAHLFSIFKTVFKAAELVF